MSSAGQGAATAPRDISTRSNLSVFVSRLRSIDNHLSNMQAEYWNQPEPPASGKLADSGTVAHPAMIDEINSLIGSIENRVEFINTRL